MIRHAVACALALPACFHPVYDRPACGPGDTCPDGLTCSEGGVCEPPGTIGNIDAAPIDGTTADPRDAPTVDARPTAFCAGTFQRACLDLAPTTDVTLATQTIDTSNPAICAPAMLTPSILACVITGRSITIPAGTTVTVIGRNPLVLLADTITISGTLDVASHRGATDGPGANSPFCATNGVAPTTGSGRADGGGGSGGSFGRKGGNGGGGGEDGLAGGAPDAIPLALLHGGCGGGSGAGTGGLGGHGGGAVALNAKTTLIIDGVVNASGASGAGGKTGGGGGGGGAGGMIVLDASTVTVTGQCFANGGGAGEGANIGANGEDGKESVTASTAGAGGSVGTTVGGDGGPGGAGTLAIGGNGVKGTDEGSSAVGGGGGGGGGVGIIKLVSTSPSGTTDLSKVSPAPL
ncbi:MAG: hypothetical protein ABIY55_08765 [Kofleriaceae bacterium]